MKLQKPPVSVIRAEDLNSEIRACPAAADVKRTALTASQLAWHEAISRSNARAAERLDRAECDGLPRAQHGTALHAARLGLTQRTSYASCERARRDYVHVRPFSLEYFVWDSEKGAYRCDLCRQVLVQGNRSPLQHYFVNHALFCKLCGGTPYRVFRPSKGDSASWLVMHLKLSHAVDVLPNTLAQICGDAKAQLLALSKGQHTRRTYGMLGAPVPAATRGQQGSRRDTELPPFPMTRGNQAWLVVGEPKEALPMCAKRKKKQQQDEDEKKSRSGQRDASGWEVKQHATTRRAKQGRKGGPGSSRGKGRASPGGRLVERVKKLCKGLAEGSWLEDDDSRRVRKQEQKVRPGFARNRPAKSRKRTAGRRVR